ncbi:MAG: nitrilase-related carbon-nitrogen hydrolase, partial [Syntrophobacter sp.]
VSFPVNGADAQKYSSFLQSLEPLKKLVVALAPYDAGFVPELVTYDKNHEDRIPFRYVRMNKPSRKMVAEKLRAVLTSARDRGVDILIFPELTVDHDALTEIHNFLSLHNSPEQLKLVIAGSFHRERNQGGGYTNSATMLDWQGNDIWRHHKLHPYMLRTAEIPENSKRTALLKLFGAESGDDAEEHIRTDYPLSFVDTPIGRMATLICLDYLASQVCETVGGVGCHYLWVPLMTTSIDTFNTHARDEYGAKYHVLSAFSASVSCPEMFGVRKEDFSFLYAPSRRFGKSGEHPDVIRSEEPPLILYQLEIML